MEEEEKEGRSEKASQVSNFKNTRTSVTTDKERMGRLVTLIIYPQNKMSSRIG